MIIIAHRRNTSAELKTTPTSYGVEIDLRSDKDRIFLAHDPFSDGENLETWLDNYEHSTLILNVKEEGLETKILSILISRNIDDFFFLDQSFPFLLKTANAGERRCAVRISEYESIDTALAMAAFVSWVWIDCFTKFPLTATDATRLKEAGLKLCLVSPELHSRSRVSEIEEFRSLLLQRNIALDAVCTKVPERWSE